MVVEVWGTTNVEPGPVSWRHNAIEADPQIYPVDMNITYGTWVEVCKTSYPGPYAFTAEQIFILFEIGEHIT